MRLDCSVERATVREVKLLEFPQLGKGNIAASGAVGWMFSPKGYIAVEKNKANEDALLSSVLEAGAEDMKTDDQEFFEIYTAPAELEKVKSALQEKSVPIEAAEVIQFSQTTVQVKDEAAQNVLALIQELEDHDDVNAVHSNFDIPR